MTSTSSNVSFETDVLSSIVALQQQVAIAPLNRQGVMALIVRMTQQLTKADGGIVEIAEGDEMVYMAASGVAERFVGTRLKIGKSLSGFAMNSGEAQICDDTATDPRVDAAACERLGIRSMILVPLRHEGNVAGVLKVASTQVKGFTDTQLQILRLMSGLLGSALARASEADARLDAIRVLQDKEREIAALNLELERKVALRTRELSDYSRRLEMALSAAHMNTWDWDFTTNVVERSASDSPYLNDPSVVRNRSARFDSIHPDDLVRVRDAAQRSREHGEDFYAEYRVVIDGETRYFTSKARPMFENGRAVRLMGVTMDVTPQREAEERMQSLEFEQRQIEVRERAAVEASEMKSAFLASVSHELRNPLHGILGMSELLTDTPLNAQQTEYVTHLRRRSETLLRLVGDVLDLSKAAAGKVELEITEFNLREVLSDATAGPALACAKKNVALNAGVSPTVPERLRGDPTRLAQLLLNLTANAAKFTAKGRIDVRLSGHVEGQDFVLTGEVEDTGIGMTEEAMGCIFKPFAQADTSITRRFGGTGLGLSICKHLAELMGGAIGVRSDMGRGSTFWFNVRLKTAAVDQPLLHGVAKVADVGRHLRVLVAEDDGVNQIIARRMLEKLGHTVTIVESGKDAVAAVQANEFDLVLMDGQMPEMSGVEATRHIRHQGERGRTLPIIAMTGDAMVDDEKRFLDAGMDAYVSKPISLKTLGEVIARTVDVPDA